VAKLAVFNMFVWHALAALAVQTLSSNRTAVLCRAVPRTASAQRAASEGFGRFRVFPV
jgi:hypothetical protein